MTNEEHNRYIAYSFFANAGFYGLILLFMLLVFSAVMFSPDPNAPIGFFAFLITFLSLIYGIFMLPSIIAGYALLKKKPWARMAGIVAGVIAGMNFPIGTGACVYALWFFFSDNWKEIYDEASFTPPAYQRQLTYGVETQRAAYEAESQGDYQPIYREPPDWR